MPRAQWFSGRLNLHGQVCLGVLGSRSDAGGVCWIMLDLLVWCWTGWKLFQFTKLGVYPPKCEILWQKKKTNSWEHVRHTVKVHFWQKLLGTVGNVQRLERPWWPGGWLEIQAQPAAQIHTYYIPIDLVCTTCLLYNTYLTIHI